MSLRIESAMFGFDLYHHAGPDFAEVSSLSSDSRKITAGDCFVAIAGPKVDGHNFLQDVIEAGANAIIVENQSLLPFIPESISVFKTADSRSLHASLLKEIHGRPDESLRLLAITGTNGKTTVANLLYQLMSLDGKSFGLLGTIGYETGRRSIEASLTTPGVEDVYSYWAEMLEAGMTGCILEASSHALDQDRLGAASIDVAAFTNLSHEHLDYHTSLEEYLDAKKKLLDLLNLDGIAVVYVDDPVLAATSWPDGSVFVGSKDDCHLQLLKGECGSDGIRFLVRWKGEECLLQSSLLGRYNLSNLLIVVAVALCSGFSIKKLQSLLPSLHPVKGRLEKVDFDDNGPVVLIDYAHTPDGMGSALQACRELTDGQLVVLFGCGGDRDRTKRSLMLQVALAGADKVFLTTDNPRSEDPEQIFADAEAGLGAEDRSRYQRIEARDQAIFQALNTASQGDLLLLAGKGHEDYQILSTGKIPWDDRAILKTQWRNIQRGAA